MKSSSQHSPGVVHAPLPYHDVPAGRLYAATVAGLQAAGIPLIALGVMRSGRQVISGCFSFSPFATESLPTSLGGSDDSAASSLGPASLNFFRESKVHSPSRTIFQETPRRIVPPAAPVPAVLAPPEPVKRSFGASVLEAIARPRGLGGRFVKKIVELPSAASGAAASSVPSADAGFEAKTAEGSTPEHSAAVEGDAKVTGKRPKGSGTARAVTNRPRRHHHIFRVQPAAAAEGAPR